MSTTTTLFTQHQIMCVSVNKCKTPFLSQLSIGFSLASASKQQKHNSVINFLSTKTHAYFISVLPYMSGSSSRYTHIINLPLSPDSTRSTIAQRPQFRKFVGVLNSHWVELSEVYLMVYYEKYIALSLTIALFPTRWRVQLHSTLHTTQVLPFIFKAKSY